MQHADSSAQHANPLKSARYAFQYRCSGVPSVTRAEYPKAKAGILPKDPHECRTCLVYGLLHDRGALHVWREKEHPDRQCRHDRHIPYGDRGFHAARTYQQTFEHLSFNRYPADVLRIPVLTFDPVHTLLLQGHGPLRV